MKTNKFTRVAIQEESDEDEQTGKEETPGFKVSKDNEEEPTITEEP